jgi:hypothetical protein
MMIALIVCRLVPLMFLVQLALSKSLVIPLAYDSPAASLSVSQAGQRLWLQAITLRHPTDLFSNSGVPTRRHPPKLVDLLLLGLGHSVIFTGGLLHNQPPTTFSQRWA